MQPSFVSSAASASDLEHAPDPVRVDFRDAGFSTDALGRLDTLCRVLLTESSYRHKAASAGFKRTQEVAAALASYRAGTLTTDALRALIDSHVKTGRLIRLCNDVPDDEYRRLAHRIEETRTRLLAPIRVFTF